MDVLQAIPLVLLDSAAFVALFVCAAGCLWMAYDLLREEE